MGPGPRVGQAQPGGGLTAETAMGAVDIPLEDVGEVVEVVADDSGTPLPDPIPVGWVLLAP